MQDPQEFVPAGLNPASDTVGLTGLVPFEILTLPPVTLRPQPGMLRVWIDLPAGFQLDPGASILYRVFGGEAGLEFERNGQIVNQELERQPLELPYRPRRFPEPSLRGQMALDLSFRWRDDSVTRRTQDVQWRQPVVWDRSGGNLIELRFSLRA